MKAKARPALPVQLFTCDVYRCPCHEALEALRTAPHTHPCPTCHRQQPCTATGCADGPRECTTCSQCRGW